MNKRKIFNDPVYGFITIPNDLIFDLIEHRYFQRLRRIKQVSLTHYVYPGALHTRFHHALGAMHLMQLAISVLRAKGTTISGAEAEGVLAAILLHDIGHGPFSHTLEGVLIDVHHEQLSLWFMEALNEEFGGRLDLAIQIFKNEYHREFFHQLVSGQLDMDRMDYLNRDSFFTGVSEGVIGYDRIIKMLAVHEDCLVVEEKGIYSVEKFLMARRFMYWQVYLHKTVLVAEQMLVRALQRAKYLSVRGQRLPVAPWLRYFLENHISTTDFERNKRKLLNTFARLDDTDMAAALKLFVEESDPVLSYLSKCLTERRLFKIELKNSPFGRDRLEKLRLKISAQTGLRGDELDYLVFVGKESNHIYSTLRKDEIRILLKGGKIKPMSESTDAALSAVKVTKHYLCYPKNMV